MEENFTQISTLSINFKVTPWYALIEGYLFVVINDFRHSYIVSPKQIQQVILNEKVIALRNSLQGESRLLQGAVIVHEKRIGSVRAAGIESLYIVFLEERGPHLYVNNPGTH